MRQRMGKRQETTSNLFVKRMLKMACNALCYRVLITCYLHMHSIVSDQRNRPIREWTDIDDDDGDECDAERTEKKLLWIMMSLWLNAEEWSSSSSSSRSRKRKRKRKNHTSTEMISTYCIKSLENGNFMRVSQMNWAIFIWCSRHPRRFQLRFLTQTHTSKHFVCCLKRLTCIWLLYYVCVLMKNRNFLIIIWDSVFLSLSFFLLLTHTQSPSLILI